MTATGFYRVSRFADDFWQDLPGGEFDILYDARQAARVYFEQNGQRTRVTGVRGTVHFDSDIDMCLPSPISKEASQ